MATFAKNQEQIREQVSGAFGANPAFANFEAMTRRNMEMFQQAMRMFTPMAPAPEAEQDKAEEPAGEIDALKAQLAAMQEQIERIAGGKG